MPFDPRQFAEGQNYDAAITAAKAVESKNGTPGLWMRANTDQGEIEGTIHITHLTRDRAEKTLNDLGISSDTLATDEFWEDPGRWLIGTECSIVPEIHEYEAKSSWRVKWWNQRRRVASTMTKQRAASLFGARSGGAAAAAVEDREVPF